MTALALFCSKPGERKSNEKSFSDVSKIGIAQTRFGWWGQRVRSENSARSARISSKSIHNSGIFYSNFSTWKIEQNLIFTTGVFRKLARRTSIPIKRGTSWLILQKRANYSKLTSGSTPFLFHLEPVKVWFGKFEEYFRFETYQNQTDRTKEKYFSILSFAFAKRTRCWGSLWTVIESVTWTRHTSALFC